MKTIHSVVIFALLLMAPLSAEAYFEANRNPIGAGEMNDISFIKFKDFPSQWHLVTARYREDNKEMRLTYANELAWQHLQKETHEPFPDGAMLGKVAFLTKKDLVFTSSAVPSESRRYQLMLKDQKKYAQSQGWGYALFDATGKVFREDPMITTKSCVACHQIAQKTGFVFSSPMFLPPMSEKAKSALAQTLGWVETPRASVEANFLKNIPPQFQSVDLVAGDLKLAYFSGTLEEIIPSLVERTEKTRRPAALLGDKSNFTLVVPEGEHCYQVLLKFEDKVVRNEESCHQ